MISFEHASKGFDLSAGVMRQAHGAGATEYRNAGDV